MKRKLFPHQAQALEYARQTSSPALFMEMRLGKTLVAIRWALEQARHRQGRVMVVAPLSVLPTWTDELAQEGIKEVYLIEGVFYQRRLIAEQHTRGFFLINYERLRVTPELLNLNWEVLILDESTRIRNPKAQITKLLITHSKYIPSKAILSGMPAPESHLDYVAQFLFLYPSFMQCRSFWQFRDRYFFQHQYDWDPKLHTLDLMRAKIQELSFILTRKQAGMGSRKIYERRYVELTAQQKKMYRKIEDEFAYSTPEGDLVETKWNPVKLTWMARIAGGFSPDKILLSKAKLVEILNLLKGELAGEQVVIWFRFNEELRFVNANLQDQNIASRPITGATTSELRKHHSVEFRAGKVQVLCVQEKCGMFGVDWSTASTAIYYSNHYEAEARAQSEDRILHPRKSEPLLYIDLVTRDTVDVDVVKTLREKKIDSKLFMLKFLANWRTRCQK